MAAPATVHPLQPRFAQAITGTLCLEGTIFQTPPAVVVALVLVLLSLAGPRWSPVGWVFRRIAPPPRALEPAAPPRFAQGMAAVFLAIALALFALGQPTAGWVVTAAVAAVALFSAISGICVGCEAYRLLLATRRGGDGDVRADLGLDGPRALAGGAHGARLRTLRAGRARDGAGGRGARPWCG